MLCNCYELMTRAKSGGYAIPAFNIDNLESALAVAAVMREMKTPVIVQTIPRTLNYGTVAVYPAMMQALMADCDVDWAMHLDHGNGLELSKKCIAAGFSSVMYDGSALPLAENIAATSQIVAYARPLKVSVEAELGRIGGKEQNDDDAEASYTKVDEVVQFVNATDVDTLAIGVGTAHGIYKGTPHINVGRIAEIAAAIDTPLVLHGASGLSEETVKACIAAGITKINFATELRQAFTLGARAALERDKSVFDPKLYLIDSIEEIKSVLRSKIAICYGL